MLFSSPLRQSISKYKNKQYKDVKISQYSQQFQSNVQLNSNNFKRFYSAPSILRETDISSIITPNVDKSKVLIPKEILRELNRKIIGQEDAKKAVANALRNRWRRKQLSEEMKNEIVPKNILMVGPTGVGKTEIARRLAKLTNAPFIKVEATKFTEVGFHGRDVDQIIRDLLDNAIQDAKSASQKRNIELYKKEAEETVLDLLLGARLETDLEMWRKMIRNGDLDDKLISVPVKGNENNSSLRLDPSLLFSNVFKLVNTPQSDLHQKIEQMTVKEALKHYEKQESEKLNMEEIIKEAISAVEEEGIVFIDEIDKICSSSDSKKQNADASSEGVQRDLLPLIEGSVISTKHGNVDTSKILFIASGAFYSCKTSDLLPELQGRLPIRVELKALTEEDLFRILTEPEMNLIQQQIALMQTENIQLEFTHDAIKEMAFLAADVNRTVENIGARRLHTIIEKIVEDISFNCDLYQDKVVITADMVKERLLPLLKKADLSKFVL